MKQRQRKQTRGIFEICVVALIAVIVVCVLGTVKVMAADAGWAEQTAYYLKWKEGYTDMVREYMAERGYGNSGIAVTLVREGDRCRYRISIHHDRLEGVPEEGLKELAADVEEMAVDVGPENVTCVFR